MKVKTSELVGRPLRYAVVVANVEPDKREMYVFALNAPPNHAWVLMTGYHPDTDWAQGGPIVEREELSIEPLYTADGLDCWQAYGHNLRYDDHGNYIQGSDNRQYGPTPLIAAMRTYVASNLGDEVDVPEELL